MSIGDFRLASCADASDYSDAMNPDLLRKRIQERLDATHKEAVPVARDELNRGRDYLRDFLVGDKQSIKADVLPALARALNCSLEYLTDASVLDPGDVTAETVHVRKSHTVPVVGYVGAGSQAHFYASGDGELDRVEAPEEATEKTVAAEIRGESMGPLLDTWLVFWDEVRNPVTPDLFGHICVVGLPGDKVLIKQIKPAGQPNYFHLISNNEGPMLDQEVLWAAKVKSMRPR